MKSKDKAQLGNLDFEIKFYEKILKETPNFIEALIVLADLYTKRGFYELGLKIDQRLSKLRPKEPIVHYNLACSYSLVGDINQALNSLKLAIDLGYNDFDFMNKDPDLENLRANSLYQRLIESLKKLKNIR